MLTNIVETSSKLKLAAYHHQSLGPLISVSNNWGATTTTKYIAHISRPGQVYHQMAYSAIYSHMPGPYDQKENRCKFHPKKADRNYWMHASQNSPIQIWCRFVPQVEITLNLLQISQVDGTKLAYEASNGKEFDWNRTLLTPISARARTVSLPNVRSIFQSHAIATWCDGQAMKYHSLFWFFLIQQQGTAQTPAPSSYFRRIAQFKRSPRVTTLLWRQQIS